VGRDSGHGHGNGGGRVSAVAVAFAIFFGGFFAAADEIPVGVPTVVAIEEIVTGEIYG